MGTFSDGSMGVCKNPGKVPVPVAIDVAARGIDGKDIGRSQEKFIDTH
jgi:hypothetical protein